MEIKVDYIPNEKQALFHKSGSTEAIYGGAKGGGKSCALIMEAMMYGLEYPGSNIYLFRETYADLEDTLIPEWRERVPLGLYKWHGSKFTSTLINGSVIRFRYVRNYEDAVGYQGRSMDFIGVDELTKHEEKTIQELMSCMRSAKGYPTRFRGTCNPGGIGHHWVKGRYVSGTEYGKKKIIDPLTKNHIEFIPATVYDNTVLMENDPMYVKRLENLPYEQRRAFLHGDWDVFEGMALESFSEAIHVVDPFEIPKHWRRWIAVDNGYTDPFAWYWMAVDEVGTVYIYREYTREYEDDKVIYSKQAERALELSSYIDLDLYKELDEVNILDTTKEIDYSQLEKIDYIVIGHDAWQKHPSTKTIDTPLGKSILDYYRDGGIDKLAGFKKPLIDRRLRKATWIEYLEPFEDQEGNLTSKVKIFRNCKKLIETLPLLTNDKKDTEKVAESTIDHYFDAGGYGLISFHASKTKSSQEDNRIEEHKKRLASRGRMYKRRLM